MVRFLDICKPFVAIVPDVAEAPRKVCFKAQQHSKHKNAAIAAKPPSKNTNTTKTK